MFREGNIEIERGTEEGVLFESAYRESLKIFKRDSIELDDFKEVYGEEEVERDKEETERLKNIYKEEMKEDPEKEKLKKFATIFEAIIHQHGEQAEWFGPNAYTIKSSDYDDFKNGVDEILEFHKESGEGKEISHLTMGIDVTTKGSLDDKLRSVWRKVKSGELSEVKYFGSEEVEKGKLEHVPSVAVNAEPREIKKVMDLWMEGRNKEIANHPLQIRILEQMEGQLETFQNWARENEKENLANIFEERLRIIQSILEGKAELKGDLEAEGKIMGGAMSPKELIKNNLKRIMDEEKY